VPLFYGEERPFRRDSERDRRKTFTGLALGLQGWDNPLEQSLFERRTTAVNKSELVQAVAKSAGLTNAKAAEVVSAVIGEIAGTLAKGDKVQIAGFGTFEVRQRAAREARNPQDPTKKVKVPARKVPAFRAGKALKEKVR
jgi:DNA-binding protein HU-beta